ncbi:MAG: FAD-dependent oxidoreductase, partial [Phycisphaerales bacterium]|nr:FAD-dependent oxidoreductase [Phycisphaerales bacterium]
MHADVTIIGAGLAGLTCARELSRDGARVVLLEASDAPGGRVRTDHVHGPGGTYLVDRGFQVYLTAYPTAPHVLNHAALDLRAFEPGAVVMHDGKAHALMDPWRRPGNLLDGALSKVGTMGDKLKVGVMRSEMQRMA